MPSNRTYTWALYILIFWALFFLAANLTSQIFLKGETVAVPDLKGLTVQEAKNELAKLRVSIEVSGAEFSSGTERGKVIRQDPAPGFRLKVFKRVGVVVSKGSELVTVPKVTGLNLENVGSALGDAGLRKGDVTLIHTPHVPAGRVIVQYPAADSQAFRDSNVDVLVSQGEEDDRFVMPDLIQARGESVRKVMSQLGFKVSITGAVYYPGSEPGTIIRQFPPSGYPVQKTTLIQIEVSK